MAKRVKVVDMSPVDATLLATLADHPYQTSLDLLKNNIAVKGSLFEQRRSERIADAIIKEFARPAKRPTGFQAIARDMLSWAVRNRTFQAASSRAHETGCTCGHCVYGRKIGVLKHWIHYEKQALVDPLKMARDQAALVTRHLRRSKTPCKRHRWESITHNNDLRAVPMRECKRCRTRQFEDTIIRHVWRDVR